MPVIVPYHLVCLEIPTFHHFVFATAEQVRLPRGNGESAHSADMACECKSEVSRREVPDLDGPVSRPGSKPLVIGLDGESAHPA